MLIPANSPNYRCGNLDSNAPFLAQASNTQASAVKTQNRYETLFIKLFSQLTLNLIVTFVLIFCGAIVLCDLSGFKANFSKPSYWFQAIPNILLFILMAFAKLKLFTNVNSSTCPNPLSFYLNRDQLILVSVWTVSAYNFGSWYLRLYAPHIYKIFDHAKGKSGAPVLREQYFLLWCVLLLQGLVFWSLNTFSLNRKAFELRSGRVGLVHYLRTRVRDVAFLPQLLCRSVAPVGLLLFLHVFVAWFAFPGFSWFISGLVDIQQPVRHSWLSIFRLGLFIHVFYMSLLLNMFYSLLDWLIEYNFQKPLSSSSLIPREFEKTLVTGVSEVRNSYIHLQACAELAEISKDSNSSRRRKIFLAIEDEGSLSRKLCEFFTAQLREVIDRSRVALKDLDTLEAILCNNDSKCPDLEIMRLYRERSTGLLGGIARRMFGLSSGSKAVTGPKNSELSPEKKIPEIFACRFGQKMSEASMDVAGKGKETELPIVFEYGSVLEKYLLGRWILSYWIASRKLYCLERLAETKILVEAMSQFIVASFVEDERGQVQMVLPAVLENWVESIEALNNLLKSSVNGGLKTVEDVVDDQIDSFIDLLKNGLKSISLTFGSSLEELRISRKCLETIKSISNL